MSQAGEDVPSSRTRLAPAARRAAHSLGALCDESVDVGLGRPRCPRPGETALYPRTVRLLQRPQLTLRNDGHGSKDDRAVSAALDPQSLSCIVLPERYLTALPDHLDTCSSYLRHMRLPSAPAMGPTSLG